MIRAAAVQLPAITFTWDGTLDDARQIITFLQQAMPAEDLIEARYTSELKAPTTLHLWFADLTEMGTQIVMHMGDTAAIVVHPDGGTPLWVIERGEVPQMTVVLQEAHRSIGG